MTVVFKVHDLTTSERLAMWKGHSAGVLALTYLGGDTCAEVWSGGADHAIICWEMATGALVRTLKQHTGSVTTLSTVCGIQQVVSGLMDKTVRLWNHSGICVHVLSHHTGYVSSVLPLTGYTRQQFWSLSSDKTVKVFELRRTLDWHTAPPTTLTEEEHAPRLALQAQMLRQQHTELTIQLEALTEQAAEAERKENAVSAECEKLERKAADQDSAFKKQAAEADSKERALVADFERLKREAEANEDAFKKQVAEAEMKEQALAAIKAEFDRLESQAAVNEEALVAARSIKDTEVPKQDPLRVSGFLCMGCGVHSLVSLALEPWCAARRIVQPGCKR